MKDYRNISISGRKFAVYYCCYYRIGLYQHADHVNVFQIGYKARLSIIWAHCVLHLPRSTLRSYSLPPLRLDRSRTLPRRGFPGFSSSQCFLGHLTLQPLAACGHCLVPVRQDPCVTSKGRNSLRFMLEEHTVTVKGQGLERKTSKADSGFLSRDRDM